MNIREFPLSLMNPSSYTVLFSQFFLQCCFYQKCGETLQRHCLYSLLLLQQKMRGTHCKLPISPLRILQTLKTFINHPALLKKGRFVRESGFQSNTVCLTITASSYMTTYWRISSYLHSNTLTHMWLFTRFLLNFFASTYIRKFSIFLIFLLFIFFQNISDVAHRACAINVAHPQSGRDLLVFTPVSPDY